MIVDRILKIIELKGINKSRFYKETGLSNGFLDKVRDIGVSKIEHILNVYPELNPNWLLTGKGEMLVNTDKIIAERTFNVTMDHSRQVPVLEPEVVGGLGNSAFAFEEKDVKEYYTIPAFDKRGVDFIIPLTGHSMEPRFLHGDMLACKIIKENAFIEWNKPHVIATIDRGMILKRLRTSSDEDHLLMVSENPEYEPFEVPKDEITGIALVVGIIRLE